MPDDTLIDDPMLEMLLRDAADGVEVPPDGPRRILAARGAAQAPSRHNTPKAESGRRRPLRAVAALVASVLVVGGIAGVVAGGGGSGVKGSADHVANSASPRLGGGTATLGPQPSAGGAAGTAPLPGGALQQGAPNLVPGPSQTKVIKNGSMTLQVTSVDSAVSQLWGLAGTFGGYVASTSTSEPGGGQQATADVTIRVPEASFESLTAQARSLGTASQVTISGQDVTSQYADLKARLQAVQSTINQLQLIETKAQTIGDVLAVEQQISEQQTQADQIQGQLNVLDDQTTFASMSVHLVQKQKKAAAAPPPPRGISKAWDHARHSFTHGVEAVLGSLGGVAVFLLFAGILFGLARVGWFFLRRRLV